MRSLRIGTLAVVLVTALAACDDPLQPGPATLEVGPDDPAERGPAAATPSVAPAVVSGEGLAAFAARGDFDAAVPARMLEDFEDAVTSTAASCIGSFDSLTDNDCFAPGGIVEGISIRAVRWDRLSVLRPPVAGVTSTVAGPGSWGDSVEIAFTGEGGAHAVGLDLLAPQGGPAPIDVELFGLDGEPLGTAVAQAGDTESLFWGIVSEAPIARVVLAPGPDVGLLIDDLAFGAAAGADATVAEVSVDVRQRTINPTSRGLIPVAVLSDQGFDATTLVLSTVRFGPGEAAADRDELRTADLNGDGLPDVLFHFPTPDAALECDETEARLSGETLEGSLVEGWGSVQVLCAPEPGTPRRLRPGF